MGDSVQREISELLPFLLNGTLSADERQSVERALSMDAGLRAELEFLTRVQAGVRADDLGQSPGAFGFARLTRELSSPAQPSRMVRAAALAAAFAIGAVLSAFSVSRFLQAPEGYSQAGAPSVGGQLVVAFRPGATADQISDLLLSQGATIVDGPSALGLYRIAVADGADAKAVAAGFAAASGVVESAEVAR